MVTWGLPLSKHILLLYNQQDSHWSRITAFVEYLYIRDWNLARWVEKNLLLTCYSLSLFFITQFFAEHVKCDFHHDHFKCTHFSLHFANFTNPKLLHATCAVVPTFEYWKYRICFKLGIVYKNNVKVRNLSYWITLCMYATLSYTLACDLLFGVAVKKKREWFPGCMGAGRQFFGISGEVGGYPKVENPKGRPMWNSVRGGGLDIFWNYTFQLRNGALYNAVLNFNCN